MKNVYDCIVIGGGPAGSTAAEKKTSTGTRDDASICMRSSAKSFAAAWSPAQLSALLHRLNQLVQFIFCPLPVLIGKPIRLLTLRLVIIDNAGRATLKIVELSFFDRPTEKQDDCHAQQQHRTEDDDKLVQRSSCMSAHRPWSSRLRVGSEKIIKMRWSQKTATNFEKGDCRKVVPGVWGTRVHGFPSKPSWRR